MVVNQLGTLRHLAFYEQVMVLDDPIQHLAPCAAPEAILLLVFLGEPPIGSSYIL